MKLALPVLLLVGLIKDLPAQVILESGAITGSTATSAAAAGKGAGKGIGNIFGNVEKTLKGSAKPQPTSTVALPPAPTLEKPVEPVKLPDVRQISTGMTREELLAKFGSPSVKMTIPEGSHIVERYRYDVDKDSVKVILEDGKVTEAIFIHPEPVIGVR